MKILCEDWIFNIADFGRRLEAGFEGSPGQAAARPPAAPGGRPRGAGPEVGHTCGPGFGMISFFGGDL